MKIIICLPVFFCTGVVRSGAQQVSDGPTHSFALGDSTFLLDGRPLQMISGEMHCARIPREYWRDRMKAAKAMGLNTIGTYVFWNAHEPEKDHYDFSGNNDIAGFIQIAKEEGLWVVLRPSPYVCAEWEFGGYPWWLLKDPALKVRSKDPAFLEAYRKYIHKLAEQLAPLQVTHGGNILMIQIENEYGSYGNDKAYLDVNRQLFREAGFDGVLFTCDGAPQMPAGYLPGYLPAVNGLDNAGEVKALIKKYHDGKGPFYIAEWYPGWFDSWGSGKHAAVAPEEKVKRLDEVLAAGISINMYMFHGGTTRGFMNGANFDSRQPYLPQTASYDYDAPLDEAGNPTKKFFLFREVIRKYLPAGTVLPPAPAKHPTIAIPNIPLTAYSSLWENLPRHPVVHAAPLSFEDLNQDYGYVLYRTRPGQRPSGLLSVKELRDYATVYVNKKRIGVLDRRLKLDSLLLPALTPDDVLDILVENNGRINYGPYLTDNRQGITEKVLLNGKLLEGWSMYSFPFSNPASLANYTYSHKPVSSGPALYKGSFLLAETGDTYLDMRSFGKGVVFLNGHHLGKYWDIGPTGTIYVPGCWLKKGQNEIIVFDQLKDGHTGISTRTEPILDIAAVPLTQADTSLTWKEGYLDIHHFFTGRGNAAFFILPDGTTMLIDAGEIGGSFGQGQTLHIAPAYPDTSRSAGEWISRYIRQLMPAGRPPCIDYALITHFHADHYGNITPLSPLSVTGKYRLSGITGIGDQLPIHYLIDRDYPLYNFPVDLRQQYSSDSTFINYLSFVNYQVQHQGMKADTLQLGMANQIRLLNDPRKYPSFAVTGIKCNGTVWYSSTHTTRPLFQAADIVSANGFNENPLSLALKISYGKFDYFTGGDNTGLRNDETPAWFDVETPMAASIGKVEACTFDHHGNRDAMNATFLRTLSPRVLIQQTWCSDHPGQELAYRLGSRKLYPGDRDVFATYIHPETKVAYGSWFVNTYKSMEGHIILRVLPGGDHYLVMVAETVNGELRVKKSYGPYLSE